MQSESYQILETISERYKNAPASVVATFATEGERLIGFEVGGFRFVVPASSVAEVAAAQTIHPLPQTKAWLRGVVNLKGLLLSLVDLATFAGATRTRTGQLLVFNEKSLQVAFLVRRIFGFRYFGDDLSVALNEVESAPEGVAEFVSKAYQDAEDVWYYLEMGQLINSPQFLEVQ